ncbi:hypothetical protein [Devosia psychrophila]|uniref:Uncharacterized protein n=1 Tax=Devosia psychrophila TaxID=728005 RepID=A0A0F5PX71_9HYPH|nr:hypothetical protein [Devosia psychrophila]KKC33262.1 hypothetical protein WH91_09490 [Devosia psychrophila]SFC24836.1 hypothetical protein SAMN04488059_103146 [Devosia psychrophila]
MEYFQDAIDRTNGDILRVSVGEWITISELAKSKGVGPRQTRAILVEMGFLASEGQDRDLKLRLASWVTDCGWGRRQRSFKGIQFDVIGPDAHHWINDRWDNAVGEFASLSNLGQTARDHLRAFLDRRIDPDMAVQEQVCWLVDFYPALSQSDKARIIGVTQQVVSKYEKVRRVQIDRRISKRNAILH